jgi:hypothetical protein
LWRELRQCDCAQSHKSAAQWKFTNPTSTLTLRLSFCTVSCPCLYIACQQLQHLSCSPLAAVTTESGVSTPHPSWPASKSTAPAASCTCTHRQLTCKARVESRRRTPARIGARPRVLSSSAVPSTLQRRAPPRSCSVRYCNTALRFGMQRAN